jgi:flagellar hook-basal body protein
MEDLVSKMQENIQQTLTSRFGYSNDAASKVTVNVQNGNEIRLTSGDGVTVSGLTLSTVSTGAPVSISNSFASGTIATAAVGTYTLLDMEIGSTIITDLDISAVDSRTLEAFAKQLQTSVQTALTAQKWSSTEAGLVEVKVNDAKTGLIITDGSGNRITQFTIARSSTDSNAIQGTKAGSSLVLADVAFSETKFGNENRLNHFKDFTVSLTTPAGLKLTKTVDMATILAKDAATATPMLTNFDPTDTEDGPDQLTALAGYMGAEINIATGWTNLSGTPVNGIYPTVSRAVGDPLTLAWESDTGIFTIATEASSGTFLSGMSFSLNTNDATFGSLLTKGGAINIVPPEKDSSGVATSGSSLTLSNVSFPQSAEAVGDEFESFTFTVGGTVYPTTGVISLDTLNLSSSPMTDLALALQNEIRAELKKSDATTWDDIRTSKISVSVVNGKDLKITDAGGADITDLKLTPKDSAKLTVSTGAKSYSIPKLGNKVTASYDPVSQKFNFTPPLGSGTIVGLSGINNQIGITSPITQDAGSDALSTEGAPAITNSYIRALKMQRYGMKVEYDTVNEKFIFKSGSTGDDSSIKLTDPSTYASEHFGLLADGNYEVKTSSTAVRGIESQAAVMQGSPLGINANNNFSVNLTNNKFVVSVDDVKGTVYLEPKDTYTIDSFVLALQNGINRLAGPADQNGLTGPMVSGVKVAYDAATNRLKFTSGTASTNSFIKVSGDSQWGLANVEGGRGATSSWIKPTQYTQVVNGVAVAQYIDEFGNETFSPDGFKSLPEWSPIFLEKGELTFDTGGNLVSPKQGSQLDTVYLPDGKGALTININYSKSTQFSSPYAVLSQSQDGAPEGDLVGLSMGDDGLVNASYSNGSQKSLGKVVLVNFTNPTGLRQIGDTSYYKSASSGTPKYGEAGSAGFGTVRSGATERANVDLTQELVDLITAQRNFQANAKAIETSTTLTQSIIQIRA